MRVSPETREKTRRDLLEAAEGLFAEVGFAGATTRAVAQRAGVATGTVFNYFPTKEALAAAVLQSALQSAWREREASHKAGESPEEALFGLVAVELRHLIPYRAWVADLFEAGLSPLRRSPEDGAQSLRVAHLERAVGALRRAGSKEPSDLSLHVYWTLYLGVLAYWARDASEKQTATLALLDRSVQLFCHAERQDETAEA